MRVIRPAGRATKQAEDDGIKLANLPLSVIAWTAVIAEAAAVGQSLELVLGLHQSHRAGGATIRFSVEDRSFGVDT